MRPIARTFAAVWLAAGCGGGSDDPGEARFPSRDWSGSYAMEVQETTTSCAGPDAGAPPGELLLEVRQSRDNDAEVFVGPLIALAGRFDGDELEAGGTIHEPVPLPDSLLERTTPADSLETIVYALHVSFSGEGALEGTYRIRAPDLVALARGTGARRCEIVHDVRGMATLMPAGEVRRRGPAGRR